MPAIDFQTGFMNGQRKEDIGKSKKTKITP